MSLQPNNMVPDLAMEEISSKLTVDGPHQSMVQRHAAISCEVEEHESEAEKKISAAVKQILGYLVDDCSRDGLLLTPNRVARSLRFFTRGYRLDINAAVNGAIFEEEGSEMVLVKDIEIVSLCEHHLLTFEGVIHVGYVPNGRVMGLSKVARVAEIFAARLQIQERLTYQVANAIVDILQPHGVAVVMECAHTCMSGRGVKQRGAVTITQHKTGIFKTDTAVNEEFHALLKQKSGRQCG